MPGDITHISDCHLLRTNELGAAAAAWSPRTEEAEAQQAEISMELRGFCRGYCSTGSFI